MRQSDLRDEGPSDVNLNPKDYWVIAPLSVEGMFLSGKLMKLYYKDIKEADQDIVIVIQPSGMPTYYMRKTRMTAEQLGKIIGKTVEQLQGATVIKLRGKAPPPEIPTPNVPYWGEA